MSLSNMSTFFCSASLANPINIMANSSNSSDLHLLLTVLLSASHVAVRIYAVVARHVNLPLPSPRYSWAHAFPHFRSLIDGTPRGGEMQHAGRMYRSFRTGAIINCYRTGTVSTGIYDVSLLERALIISRESDEPYWLMLPHAPVQTQVSSSHRMTTTSANIRCSLIRLWRSSRCCRTTA